MAISGTRGHRGHWVTLSMGKTVKVVNRSATYAVAATSTRASTASEFVIAVTRDQQTYVSLRLSSPPRFHKTCSGAVWFVGHARRCIHKGDSYDDKFLHLADASCWA